MNALVPVNTAPAMTVSDVERVANAIAKGGLFGSKDPNAVLTLCLLAQAEGQHPAVVFRDYHIIQGKPAKKAEAMLRDFINAGGKVEWHTLTDDCADATFTHPSGSARIDWTLARAKQAGISTAMWQKYPRQMLRSRVISEGIRTVYPGATSGLYEEGEVASFTNGETVPHNPQTGEIDANRIETHEPAAREKLDGPHTSKTALKAAVAKIVRLVEACESVDAIETVKTDNKRTINQARRDWPELIDGDPNCGEDIGLKGTLAKRRTELEHTLEYQLLVSTLLECTSGNEYQGWLTKNGDVIDSLDGAESRAFEAIHEEKAEALKLVDTASAG